MGPPEFTGGNTPRPPTRPRATDRASMGPPEFTGGNERWQDRDSGRNRSLQWGRRNSPAETGGIRGRRARNPPGFNGAAGIHRRKLPIRQAEGCVAGIASMGPPEFTGGNPPPPAAGGRRRQSLQWGRRNSPAETDHEWAETGPERGALQWGRRNSPAETALTSKRRSSGSWCFNGAAGIHRRKLSDDRPPHVPLLSSFNGAAGIHRRKLGGGDALGRRGGATLQWGRRNSPAETWKAPNDETRRSLRLQWGRRNSPAETRASR